MSRKPKKTSPALTPEQTAAIEKSWNEDDEKEGVSLGQLAAWEETKKLDDEDQSDFARAFRAEGKLELVEKELRSPSLFSIRRRTLKKKADALKEELAHIAENSRGLALLLKVYQRRNDGPNFTAEDELKAWISGERDDIGSYATFIQWCKDKLDALDRVKVRKPLGKADTLMYEALFEITQLEERSIQKRLMKQFGAHGRPGRRRNEKTKR